MTESGDESGEPQKYSDVSAIIVAGGPSARFGSDKVFADVRSKPMLQHVYDAVCKITSEVVVSLRPDQPQTMKARYVVDRVSAAGPLAGLEAGIAAATGEWVVVVAGDMPMVRPDDLRALLDNRSDTIQAVVAVDESGRLQPLCACYHCGVYPIISQMLDEGKRAVHGLLDRVTYRTVLLPSRSLANVNERADLKHL